MHSRAQHEGLTRLPGRGEGVTDFAARQKRKVNIASLSPRGISPNSGRRRDQSSPGHSVNQSIKLRDKEWHRGDARRTYPLIAWATLYPKRSRGSFYFRCDCELRFFTLARLSPEHPKSEFSDESLAEHPKNARGTHLSLSCETLIKH